MITIELPWPPSVNHYYRHVGPRVLISKDGRNFRDVVSGRLREANVKKFTGPVELNIQLYPPDNRRRDIDNILKSLFDSLTHGGLYGDDSQVKRISGLEMLEPMPPHGMVVIKACEYVKNPAS